jgi:hypothetical protein
MKVVTSFAFAALLSLILVAGCNHGQNKASQAAVTQPKTGAPATTPPAAGIAPAAPSAQKQGAPPAAASNEPAGIIKFETTTHNFGDMDPNSLNSTQFTFTNVGKGRLKIGTIGTSCGCTVAALDKYDYAPGESGTIKVTYHATKMAGTITKQIFAPSNDPQNPRVELILKGTIVIKVDCHPDTMKLALDQPNAGAPQITLTSKDGKAFAITGYESSSNAVIPQIDPNVKETHFVVPLKIDMDRLRTALNGYLRLNITHPSIDVIAISYSTPAEFDTLPSSIIVRDAIPAKPVIREISVMNNYNKPFEITSISSKNGSVKVLKQEKDKDTYRLSVEITPPENNKMMFFSDTLIIKLSTGNDLSVNCRGFYNRNRHS